MERDQRDWATLSEHAKRISRRFDGSAEAVGAARAQVRDFLTGLVPPLSGRFVTDALIAVSELVTNAVQHAPGPLGLEVELGRDELRIGVSDTSTSAPRPRKPLFDGTGGLGLHMLFELAGEVETRLHPGGKTVSVRLRRASA